MKKPSGPKQLKCIAIKRDIVIKSTARYFLLYQNLSLVCCASLIIYSF